MTVDPVDFTPLRFSTGALPVQERLPFWREVFGRQMVRVDIEPQSEARFEATATLRAAPGLRSMSCTSSEGRLLRPREFIAADGDDTVSVFVNLSGTVVGSQLGRDVSLGIGDAAIILNAEPALMAHSQIHYEGLVIPRATLAPLVTHVEDAAMRTIPHANEVLRLLLNYLKTVRDELGLATPALRHLIVTHIHDLVAMIVGATRDGAAIAADRGVHAARLAAVKADIVAHLDGRDLNLVAVASRQNITPRYIQRLFEREGVTFSEFVLGQRLTLANQMLTSPRYAGWTISAIALAAGFGDLSYFNRKFRQRYGATPSDVRADAHRGSNNGPDSAQRLGGGAS
jgi:AraC-like DNA-binding protein